MEYGEIDKAIQLAHDNGYNEGYHDGYGDGREDGYSMMKNEVKQND